MVVTAFVVVTAALFLATSTSAFCGLCHNMKPSVDAYRHSPHAGINCEECHTKPGPFFFLTAKLEALQEPVKQLTGYEVPILGSVQNASCRRCHTDKQLFPTISKNGIRVNHEHLILAGYQCSTCHSTVAHGTAVPVGSQTYPTMDKCLVCHNNRYTGLDGKVATSECDLCHKTPPAGAKPSNHTDAWIKIHGTNGILSTCSACHPERGATPPPGVPGSPPNCVDCHHGVLMPHAADWVKAHGGVEQKLGLKACEQCHDKRTYCDGCHQVPVPHPAGWLGEHRQQAAQHVGSCLNCHSQADCQTCHAAHDKGTPRAHRYFRGWAPVWSPPATPSAAPSAPPTSALSPSASGL